MNIITEVNHGIIFVEIDGIFNNDTYNKFEKEIDYLLYKMEINYYAFNFINVNDIDDSIFFKIQNKLIEIFLSCGKVVMYGLSKKYQRKIKMGKDRLYYVNSLNDAYRYLYL